MNDWLVIGIIAAALIIVIGNLSTVSKNAKTPLRKKGLNDLEETIPRSNKDKHILQNTRYNAPSRVSEKKESEDKKNSD